VFVRLCVVLDVAKKSIEDCAHVTLAGKGLKAWDFG
jgi:hypothetical protein